MDNRHHLKLLLVVGIGLQLSDTILDQEDRQVGAAKPRSRKGYGQ
jgi:hypothetical protein